MEAERALEAARLKADMAALDSIVERDSRAVTADAQTKLGTGVLLLVRIEKWKVSHGED